MSFTPKQAYALSKGYTDQSIEGTSGVLAGKNCQISSIIEILDEDEKVIGHRITFSWYADGSSIARTDTVDVMDGEQGLIGPQGNPGEPGVSPEITVEESTASSYKLRIKTGDDEFVTPNLKGSGGSEGIDVSVSEESLIFTYNS